MEICRTPAEIRAFSRAERAAGRSLGFVPTMGFLHEGHLSLIRTAREASDTVVLSIFVNPMQFNVPSDYEKYPRNLDTDLLLARSADVAAVYAPDPDVMYPLDFETVVRVEKTAAPLEGAGRPGHFDGVATVVTKLLMAVEADVAFFGRKDYQQLAVVKRLVTDLDIPTLIVGVDTVRESDGLAMSSRNARLTPQARLAAPVIKRALDGAAATFTSTRTGAAAKQKFSEILGQEPLARLEYVSVADAENLYEIDHATGDVVISCAVWFGEVRLIDNVLVAS